MKKQVNGEGYIIYKYIIYVSFQVLLDWWLNHEYLGGHEWERNKGDFTGILLGETWW